MNRNQVMKAIRAELDPKLGLADVPAVVRRLRAEDEPDRVHRLLHELAQAEEIQLWPWTATRPQPERDRVLCPAGPRGTTLAVIRVADRVLNPNPLPAREPFTIELADIDWATLHELARAAGKTPKQLVGQVITRWLRQQRGGKR